MRSILLILVVTFLSACSRREGVGEWVGERSRMVEVRVVDAKTGHPIPRARVWLLTGMDRYAYKTALHDPAGFTQANGPIERFGSRVYTDGHGAVIVSSPFQAGGGILSDDSTTVTYCDTAGIVRVEASRYVTFESELSALLPQSPSPDATAPLSVTVKMIERPNQPAETTSPAVTQAEGQPARKP